jgi:hypothetical protein
VGSMVGGAALGQVFSEYLGFPAHHSFHQLAQNHHHHHLSSRAGTLGQMASVVVDLFPLKERIGFHLINVRLTLK